VSETEAADVLHVITGLGPGGAEGVLARLVSAARDEAVRSVVVSLTAGGARRAEIEAEGVPVFDLGLGRGQARFSAIGRLAGIIRRYRPRVLQSWMYHADLLALMSLYWSGRRRRTRLYWGVRCSDMQGQHYTPRFRLVRAACARMSNLPDAVVANSHAGKAVHIGLGYATRNFVVVLNGIDVQRFRPCLERRQAMRRSLGLPDHARVAITAARVDPMKGYDVLAEAARRTPDLHFIVAGAGTDTFGFPANVYPLGHRSDLPALLPAADMLLSTSLFGEGFSNSIAEGMAAGLVPLVSDVGDARLIVGECGRLVPPGDAGALVAALKSVASTGVDALRAEGLRARERIVAHFSVARMVDAFDRLHLHGVPPRDSADAEQP
jgi:glycosyltransferase involved in cell wall biosynthesis